MIKRLLISACVSVCFTPTIALATQITTLAGISEKPIQIIAMNRVVWLTGENPASAKLNTAARFIRLGLGAYMWQALCGSAPTCPGYFSNLTIVPNGGVNVVVQPAVNATLGTLYQLLPEDTAAVGGYPSGQGVFLPPDLTQVMVQGTLAAPTSSIGPLTPPLTVGQSINYLVECQILTVDTTAQPIQIVSAGGSVGPATANRDRADTISCTNKAGVTATTGSQTTPVVDAGYVSVGRVSLAYGTANITSGMIQVSPPLAGAVLLSAGTPQVGTISTVGSITSGTSVSAPTVSAGAGYVQPSLTAAGAVTSPNEHTIHGQVTSAVAAGSTPCSTEIYVPLSGAGTFTNASSYSIVASVDFTASTIPSGWAYAIAPIAQRISGAQFGLQACGTANAASIGTIVINYIASGN